MSRTFDIFPEGRQFRPDGRCRLVARYERRDGTRVADTGELWYEFEAWPEALDAADADPFLMLTLPMAMEEARELRVDGAVSRSLLANLSDFRDYWCGIAPLRYRPVGFAASLCRDDAGDHPRPGAVALFSGGVDAAFTYWRHRHGLAGAATQTLRQGVFVDGFDRASFLRRESFLAAYERSRRILADEPVPLATVRTNYRQVEAEPFASHHLHMIASSAAFLGSCLHLFKGMAGTGLYPSTFSYHEADQLRCCGTNPISDRFLSSAAFHIVHDGAGFQRIAKVAALQDWPVFWENARICGTPQADGRNCGRCEKCLRTLLAALLTSGRLPPAFPTPPADIVRLVTATKVKPNVRSHWQEMARWAQEHGLHNPWAELAEAKGRKRWKERRHAFRAGLRELLRSLANPR